MPATNKLCFVFTVWAYKLKDCYMNTVKNDKIHSLQNFMISVISNQLSLIADLGCSKNSCRHFLH